MKIKKEYLTIFIIQVTEVLGFSLILPFLPFYALDLGASPFVVGLILTTFSICQFISAPILGKLSDYYGRKPLLLFSQFTTMIGFIILGFSNTLWMIFLSRIVDGLLGSNFTIAQAYYSDLSSKKDRSKAFGISGVAFGFGFLIGPAIGGLLSRINYNIPSFLAAGISFLTIIFTAAFLKETVKRKKDLKIDLKIFHFPDFKKHFSNPRISNKLWQFFTYISAHVIWVSSFALYAKKQLHLGPSHIGFMLAYIGLISIIFRGVLLGKMINFFGEKKLKFIGISSTITGFILAAFINKFWMFFIVMSFFAFGGSILRPLLLGHLSRSVSPKEQGTILGFTNSLGSLSQIFGPFIGGFLLNYFFPGSLGIAAALVLSLGLILMLKETAESDLVESRDKIV